MIAGAVAPVGASAMSSDSGAASTAVSLKKGDRGPAVRKLQRALDLTADGAFGAGTKRAVKRFQRREGLEADGVVGPSTRRALDLRPFAKSSVYRKKRKKRRRRSDSIDSGSGIQSTLDRIAECESGGDPTSVSSSGQYRGKYQFSRSTWKANGGEGGDPAEAPEAEQDRVARKLYRSEGNTPWPVCGKKS